MHVPGLTTKTLKVFSIVFISVFFSMEAPCVLPAYAFTSDDDPSASSSQIKTSLTVDLTARANPDGLMLMFGGYRRWVQETAAEGVQARYLQAGFGLGVTPAYATVSVHGEWQPAIFAKLRLEYDFYRFFGENSGLLSFPDARAKFGKDELDDLEGSEEEAVGHRVLLQPALFAKAGPMIIMNQTDLAYYSFNGDGPYFLDWEYDTLVKDSDYVIANRTHILYPAWKGSGAAILRAGPYYEITHAGDADLTRQRVGGQLYWVPVDILWGMNKPRIYSQVGVNIQDRNRKGEIYGTLGFGVDFNL